MSETLTLIRGLVAAGDVRISEHGYDELADDEIAVAEILAGVDEATVIEDYPEYPKGQAVLVLQLDAAKRAIHVVWGIPKGAEGPALVVTAYRPDPTRWDEKFVERRK